MKGSIPRQFIDDLLTKSNIVDVINARVKLKKAGRDYQACCPFHHEKTPDRKSTRLNSSHWNKSRMPSSA